MRQIHRWISLVAALFLLVVATTGVILQVQRLTGEDEDHDRDAPKALAISAEAYAPMFAKTIEVARGREPKGPIAIAARLFAFSSSIDLVVHSSAIT